VVAVTGRNSFRELALLIIRQPDGTLAQLPEWMTHPEAGSLAIGCDTPRLSLPALVGLRATLDTALALLARSTWEARHDATQGRGTKGFVRTKPVSGGSDAGADQDADAAPRGIALGSGGDGLGHGFVDAQDGSGR
jgi:hypothetical protein